MQIKTGMLRLLAPCIATAALIASSMASACTWQTPIRIVGEPENFRSECRKLLRDQDGVLAQLRGGTLDYDDISHLANSLRDGSNNCPERSDFAFAMFDAQFGSPVRFNARSWFDRKFIAWASDNLSEDRFVEVFGGSWITRPALRGGQTSCSGTYPLDSTPNLVSEDRLLAMLYQPYYWDQAIAQFGNNPGRDRLVLRALIDPANPRFDLDKAGRLAPKFRTDESDYWGVSGRMLPILVDVADAVIDPRLGALDYAAAAKILDWYSPYAPHRLDQEAEAKAQSLWVRIAQSRLADPDEGVRKRAEMILRTGNPHAKIDVPPEEVLPDGAQVVTLDSWPSSLEPLRDFEKAAERIEDDYPSRALRASEFGRVELGALFGPDGNFLQLHATQKPIGSALVRAAQRGMTRYLLPKTENLNLAGYAGKHVFVKLPPVNYRLFADPDKIPAKPAFTEEAGFNVWRTNQFERY